MKLTVRGSLRIDSENISEHLLLLTQHSADIQSSYSFYLNAFAASYGQRHRLRVTIITNMGKLPPSRVDGPQFQLMGDYNGAGTSMV